jgi:cytochrome c553
VGEHQYTAHCASCHGTADTFRVSSLFPDLRYAGALWGAEAFKAIVIGGALQSNGMVSFRKVLTAQDAEAIRAYVVHLANEAKNERPPPGRFGAGPGGGHGPGAPGAAAPAASTPAPGSTAPRAGAVTPPVLHQ